MISVVVQSIPDRGIAWERSKTSIEASDIDRYTVMVNPEGVPAGHHFLDVLRHMEACSTSFWHLRLEDDAIVNKHVMHNLIMWPALQEPDFGAGWLLTPHAPHEGGRHRHRKLHCSVGVLLKKDHIPMLIRRCKSYLKVNDRGRCPQDLALSTSVWDSGKRIYIHDPPLVEHPIDVPSTLGHVHRAETATSNGRFDPEWRRASSS